MSYYTNVSFNGTNLTDINDIKITSVIVDRLPDVQLSTGNLSRQDGVKIYNKKYASKKILVEGLITSDSREGYIEARDSLMAYTEPANKTLQVIIDNLPLEYTATVSNAIFKDSTGGYGGFSIEFIATDPFGYDRDAITILDGESVTDTGVVTLDETIGGSYKTPIDLTLQVISVTDGSGYIDLSNALGENIRVTRDWAVDDTLVINSKTKTCTVNGLNVDYSGVFFNLGVGDTTISYDDSFTARSVTITATYKRRRL